MKKALLRIEKIHQKTEGAVVFLSGLIIIIMLVLICSEVILRTLFTMSIPGIFEMASQMMVAISLLGIAYVQQKREHITIDIISDKTSKVFNKITNIVVYTIGMFVAFVFCWQGWVSFIDSWKTQEYTLGIVQIPLWPGKLSVAISMLLILIRYVLDFLLEVSSIVTERNEEQQTQGQTTSTPF